MMTEAPAMDEVTAERIRAECFTSDEERDHEKADEILVSLLRALGYDKTADAWDEAGKWYA